MARLLRTSCTAQATATALEYSSFLLKVLRRSVAKGLGEFSVREHVFYGAIFLSMTIIVMFCFLLVNRTQSNSSSFLPYQGNLGKLSID